MQEMNSGNANFTPEKSNTKTGLQIILKTDEDDARPVYISGNFNNWHTQDNHFIMEKIEDNLYQYEFALDFD